MINAFTVRPLTPNDLAPYKALRFRGLQLNPEAFGSSYEEEVALPDFSLAERLTNGIVFGAWSGESLIGCAGLASREKTKLRHKSVLWGMFVVPEARGAGVGKCLLEHVLAHAKDGCEEVLLTVVEGNDPAYRLYVSAGFEEYGKEPFALKIGDDYYHELMMRLTLRR